jgi:SAM-dependent methyltransferase
MMTDHESPSRQKPPAQQVVIDFFRLHVRLFGNDWRALGWSSRHTQQIRFAVLCNIGSLAHTRILDMGCGLGDLYGYLLAQDIAVEYTGYDLLPDMIERARLRYPEARFVVRDVLQGLGTERFDYILSSGAFNIDFGNNIPAIQQVLREMFECCTRGVAINFLSTADTNNDPIFQHYDPQEMLAYCQTFCPRVQLRQDYLPNDFTLYLHRPKARSRSVSPRQHRTRSDHGL